MESQKVLLVIKTVHDDDILCGDMTRNGHFLVTGGTSSLVKVFNVKLSILSSHLVFVAKK